jgi:hypothetical protein
MIERINPKLLSIGGSEEWKMRDAYQSAQDFLSQMDSGVLDKKFTAEVHKLSRAQIEEITEILLQRSPFRHEKSDKVIREESHG